MSNDWWERNIVRSKDVPLREERFGWACVVSWSETWSQLPVEINEMIVKQLVERHFHCVDCWQYTKGVKNSALCEDCYKKRKEEWESFLRDRIGVDFLKVAEINVE
jgi:hypothetical protein